MSVGRWESEEGTVESEPFVIEAMDAETPLVEPAAAEGVIPLESVLLEPDDSENDDTPVSLEFGTGVVPATDEAELASPLAEPNVFEFDGGGEPEVVHVEPADADPLEQLYGEQMLEFSEEETIEAEIGGKGGFATARPGAVLGRVELIRGGDRRQLSALGRLLSFF
jgi:hypothetical protein